MTSPTPLIGVSTPMLKIKELINHVAQTCLNILITGETGVGKEVVAQTLYAESNRSKNNFVKINCAALPETLLESELYGYEKGAFTGAHKKRYGKFLTADKGVLFLDEIGDMPLSLQSKMLHVLQSGEFSPLGSDQDFKTDVWVIAATNQCLEEKIKNKTFREDLFYRLNIIKIDIPPLRERPEDIPALVEYYFKRYLSQHPKAHAEKPDSQTMARLCSYDWPGNVRQLQNCIKKLMVLNSWDKIFEELPEEASTPETLPSEYTSQAKLTGCAMHSPDYLFDSESGNLRMRSISEFVDLSTSSEKLFEDISLKKIKKRASDRAEKDAIIFVLEKVGWNRSKAAKILKVSYKTLLYKMSEFNVNPPVS
ncbi:sigma-54 dependent transcriptional regulator [Desulfobacter postgatei]|uniref:sigma-54 interaction domain-containing protein n=1 Tax=Desulfobacter postgatei TaxID=2293 RepID=UPI00259BBD7C|nr:sigma-54 dependent transcriptional regulator [uncultured Desulfobacter sp.]